MKNAIIISLSLHLGLLGLAFWVRTHDKEEPIIVSEVVLIAGKNHQQAQARLVRGAPIKPEKQDQSTESETLPSKAGKDLRDQAERVAVGGSPGVRNQYALDLHAFIEKHQVYPRRALVLELEGELLVRLTIARDGSFKSVRIVEQTVHSILNDAALNLMTQLNSFRPLPQGFSAPSDFLVRINYRISRGRY